MHIKQRIKKYRKVDLTALAFFSPAIAIYAAAQSKDRKLFQFGVTLFFGIVGALYVYKGDMDGNRHLEKIEWYYRDMSFSEFFTGAWELLLLNPQPYGTDIYKHVISFLSGSLLQFPEALHFFAGITLGYFFSKSLLLLYDHIGYIPKKKIVLFLLFAFLSIRTLGALNSIRMWTGMWVLFYFILKYWNTKSLKNLILLVTVPLLFHFSYAIFVIPVAIAVFLRYHRKAVLFIYLVSLTTSISFSVISGYLPSESNLYERKSGYVYSEDSLQEKKEKTPDALSISGPWYMKYGTLLYHSISIPALNILLGFFLLKNKSDNLTNFLAISGLLMLSLSNYVGFSPSISGRSSMIGATFILASSILLVIHKINAREWKGWHWQKGLIYVYLVSSVPYVLYNIVYVMLMTSAFVFVMPIFSIAFGESDISIRDFINTFIP